MPWSDGKFPIIQTPSPSPLDLIKSLVFLDHIPIFLEIPIFLQGEIPISSRVPIPDLPKNAFSTISTREGPADLREVERGEDSGLGKSWEFLPPIGTPWLMGPSLLQSSHTIGSSYGSSMGMGVLAARDPWKFHGFLTFWLTIQNV